LSKNSFIDYQFVTEISGAHLFLLFIASKRTLVHVVLAQRLRAHPHQPIPAQVIIDF
jgi:hypothetical protein